MNWAVQDLNDKNWSFVKCNIEDFNFKNKMSHVKKFYYFQLFVNFLTDLIALQSIFLKMVSIKHIYLYKNSKISFSLEKKKKWDFFFQNFSAFL